MRWSLLVLACLLSACAEEKQQQAPAPTPPKVTIAAPTRQDIVPYYQVTGRTRATEIVEIRARVTGFLEEMSGRLEEELARLDRQLAREVANLSKSEAKLGNSRFVDNAPAAVVEQERQRLVNHQANVENLKQQLRQLKSMRKEHAT